MSRFSPRKLILSTLAAAALAATVASTAHAGGPHHGKKLERFCAEAKCTDDQKQELRNIFKEFRTDTKPDREKIGELKKRLVAEFAKDKPNDKVMTRIYAQIDQLRDNIVDRRHDMIMEIHGVLTKEQRELAAKKLLRRGRGHGRHHEKGAHE